MNGNHVIFEGNLTRDPELAKGKANGTSYVRGSLARSWKQGDVEKNTFVDFVVFGDMAENFAATAVKGTRCEISGHLNQSRWTTDDGQNRSKLEVVCDHVSVSLRWAQAVVERNPRPDTPATADAAEDIDEAELEVAPL